MRHNNPMLNSFTSRIASFLLCFLIANMAFAEETKQGPDWFQIELVFFEPKTPGSANEDWPLFDEITSLDTAVEIIQLPTGQKNIQPFQEANKNDLMLKDVANRFKRSRGYRLLKHLAWVQPVLEKQQAVSVHVYDVLPVEPVSEEDEFFAQPVDGSGLLNPLAELSEQSTLVNPESPAEPAVAEGGHINGVVTVSLSRYLHLDAKILYNNPDVYLAEQIAAQEYGTAVIDKFALRESRRMRSKETHYFDHPYFGFVARIVPIDAPPAAAKTLN